MFSRKSSSSNARRHSFRPQLNVLEDRAVPSFGWAASVPAGNNIATDTAGNVYVTGGNDVAKYSSAGALQWATSLGGSNTSIAVDNAGSVFVAGLFNGSASFGSTTLTESLPGDDGFLAKLDASTGSVSWARNGFNAFGHATVFAMGVAADSLGNAYVATTEVIALSVTKVSSSGSNLWLDKFNLAETWGGGIVVSGSNVYVTGDFMGNVDFDPGPGNAKLRSNNNESGFVLKLTTAGTYVWARAFTTASSGSHSVPDSVSVDAAGNVYTSGSFSGTVDFDPAADGKQGQGKLLLNGGSGSGFISKLNSSGNFVWARQSSVTLGGASALVIFGSSGAMTVDASGAVYLTGGFSGTVDFNPGAGVFNLTSAGGSDIFVSKLDPNGNFQWAVRAGSTGDDFGSAIAVNSFGDIYVTGRIGGGTVDFDLTSSYFDNRDLLTGPGGFLWQILQP